MKFVESFVTQFLASYAATNYTNCAVHGDYDRITKYAPVEEAFVIANDVYDTMVGSEEYQKHKQNQR